MHLVLLCVCQVAITGRVTMAQEPPNVPNAPQPPNMGGDQHTTTATFHETQDLNEIPVSNLDQRLEEMTEQIGQR